MSTDREKDANGITPETLAVEMETATSRLREQGWKISPITNVVVMNEQIRDEQRA